MSCQLHQFASPYTMIIQTVLLISIRDISQIDFRNNL